MKVLSQVGSNMSPELKQGNPKIPRLQIYTDEEEVVTVFSWIALLVQYLTVKAQSAAGCCGSNTRLDHWGNKGRSPDRDTLDGQMSPAHMPDEWP